MIKNLYKVMVQFRKNLYIEYVQAYTEKQARMVIARRIAKKQGVLPVTVLSWMKEFPDNFDILIETEFKEVDENE
ncbi:hypothetical protein [Methanosarcina virus MetMV]|nr:hypothetical protein [Methanosarcina virus MetMV]AZF89984.1 hypothetical protein [Methanosarcina virus MetMV]